MKVVWSELANQDLDAIFDYLLQENPAVAQKVLDTLRDSTTKLTEHPGIGRPGRVGGTRELVVSRYPYVMPYIEAQDKVIVLRVLHTARQWP